MLASAHTNSSRGADPDVTTDDLMEVALSKADISRVQVLVAQYEAMIQQQQRQRVNLQIDLSKQLGILP